jgi:hypothetical protein
VCNQSSPEAPEPPEELPPEELLEVLLEDELEVEELVDVEVELDVLLEVLEVEPPPLQLPETTVTLTGENDPDAIKPNAPDWPTPRLPFQPTSE